MTATPARIPYVDLARSHARLRGELLEAVGRVLDRGDFILGREVEEFEARFAELCGVRCAVGVSSGTDALVLALRALGIGEGDEVVTPPNSFVATASAIRLAGARPVLADVGSDLNLDPERVRAALTPRTRAVLPVHLTGRPADMDPILELARERDLLVVEDCAQAVSARYRGRAVGSLGRVGCFSLHPLKTLSACGDGGVLTTDDEEVAGRLRVLRNLGLRTRGNCSVWSGNSRLDTLQAAILLVKLAHLEEWTERRRAHARAYCEALAGVSGLVLPEERPHERAVYHTFIIQAPERDRLKEFLDQKGIETAVHYPLPIHLQDAGRELGLPRGSLPVAEAQAERVLSLPIYPELERGELEWITSCIRRFYGA